MFAETSHLGLGRECCQEILNPKRNHIKKLERTESYFKIWTWRGTELIVKWYQGWNELWTLFKNQCIWKKRSHSCQSFNDFCSYWIVLTLRQPGHEQGFIYDICIHVREGLNKNINIIGGIFHGGLTLPLRWKIIKKIFNFLKISSVGSCCIEMSFVWYGIF